jgi:mannose-1-phosphate guanylyltransferase / mannose-6-phosphate isomerase
MSAVENALSLVPVILSGGSGTRLWPMSRQLYPKQFIPLIGKESLFQTTLRRLEGLSSLAPPIVVCHHEHRFMAAEQLRQLGLGEVSILLEPAPRNTAPAIGVAALEACYRLHDDAVLLVLPADHIIHDIKAFHEAVQAGFRASTAGLLVTFGIVPDNPETGYGYIHRGVSLDVVPTELNVYRVNEFKEKPDLIRAEEYLSQGGYYWNSGMFMFRATDYLQELQRYAPDIHTACTLAHQQRSKDLDFIRLDPAAFEQSPGESIDYAVMEKTNNAVVIPLQAGWSDVGSWDALWQAQMRSEADNVTLGDVLVEDCHSCYVNANYRLVAILGMNNTVVIETADAVLVMPKARAQEVRTIVEHLKTSQRVELVLHRKVFRPWGAFENIDVADRFQVKRITVYPGHSLSLQMHHHRAEHWIVVKGTARVVCNDEEFLLSENESTYIPIGAKHRLENPGKITLELIEVQSGSYLREDDIYRFEDKYGR